MRHPLQSKRSQTAHPFVGAGSRTETGRQAEIRLPAPLRTLGNQATQHLLGGPLAAHSARKEAHASDPLEREADAVAGGVHTGAGPKPKARPEAHGPAEGLSKAAQGVVPERPAGGSPLSDPVQSRMESRLGGRFSGVRVHTDSRAAALADAFGANAITRGSDLFFGPGKYRPGTREGDRLLGHELSHVVQGGGVSNTPQFDLMSSQRTLMGVFEIGMTAFNANPPASNMAGEQGTIEFHPDPNGPYSARIGLVQAVDVTDRACGTASAGSPVQWRGIGRGEEAARNEVMTTGGGGEDAGWFTDMIHAGHPRSTAYNPNYIESYAHPTANNHYGWLRSPTDVGEASLWDGPEFSCDVDFNFQTVAKAADTQAIYGALDWGFQIRSGQVQEEYASPVDAQSAEFDRALERFRGYYTHAPVVIYFDTDQDTPQAGEMAKMTEALNYLNKYPDVTLELTGYADVRGGDDYNADLTFRRADNVRTQLIAMGVRPGQIDPYFIGMGETREFATRNVAPGTATPQTQGTWQSNRRVVIHFVRNASTQIAGP